jgi:hypothetical protein
MEYETRQKPNQKSLKIRNKKSDKAKKNYDKTGGFTKKHIRIMEDIKNKNLKS